jgi:hypothetical protein
MRRTGCVAMLEPCYLLTTDIIALTDWKATGLFFNKSDKLTGAL